MDYKEKIDIPFGAKNSELKGWEYTIPEGMEAIIKDDKVIVREKESEDERIRKELIALVRMHVTENDTCLVRGGKTTRKEAVAYLEKQKEQKDYSKLYEDIAQSEWFKKAYVGKSLGEEFEQKEQKPVQDKEEREYVCILKSLIANFLRDKEEVVREYYQDIYDWLDGRHIEQKPAEWSEEDENALEYLQQEQPEVDLEKFTEKMNAWKARYNHPDNIPIKATMAFTARMFYQYPNVARQWYEQLPKATMD